jgi:hypothetical protein
MGSENSTQISSGQKADEMDNEHFCLVSLFSLKCDIPAALVIRLLLLTTLANIHNFLIYDLSFSV